MKGALFRMFRESRRSKVTGAVPCKRWGGLVPRWWAGLLRTGHKPTQPSSVWRLYPEGADGGLGEGGWQMQAGAAELGSSQISPQGGESGEALVKLGAWGQGTTRRSRPSS